METSSLDPHRVCKPQYQLFMFVDPNGKRVLVAKGMMIIKMVVKILSSKRARELSLPSFFGQNSHSWHWKSGWQNLKTYFGLKYL